MSVGTATRCKQNEVDVFFEMKLGPDDEFNAALLCRHMRLGEPCIRAFIGDGNGLIAELGCPFDHFFRV